MTENRKQSDNSEEFIDISDVVNTLIASKIFILTLTLVITIITLFYVTNTKPTFHSQAFIRIGQDVPTPTKSPILIEPFESLRGDLSFNFSDVVVVNTPISGLIKVSTIQPSAEISENLINELSEYVIKKHKKIAAEKTKELTSLIEKKIQVTNDRLDFIYNFSLKQKNADLDRLKDEILDLEEVIQASIEQEIKDITRELAFIDDKINSLNLIILEDTSNPRPGNSPTLKGILYEYNNGIQNLKNEKNILLDRLEKLTKSQSVLLINEKVHKSQQDLKRLQIKLKQKENNNLMNETFFLQSLALKDKRNALLIELETLSNSPTQTNLTGKVITTTIEPQRLFYVIISLFFGFIFSVLLVLLKFFLKPLKIR
jgi:hypothetical protein